MNKYIGIAQEDGNPWFWFNIILYDRMILVAPWTRLNKPTIIYHNKSQFAFTLERDVIRFKWFIGIMFN